MPSKKRNGLKFSLKGNGMMSFFHGASQIQQNPTKKLMKGTNKLVFKRINTYYRHMLQD